MITSGSAGTSKLLVPTLAWSRRGDRSRLYSPPPASGPLCSCSLGFQRLATATAIAAAAARGDREDQLQELRRLQELWPLRELRLPPGLRLQELPRLYESRLRRLLGERERRPLCLYLDCIAEP
mmetsp:Transcript_122863/g.238959  ORF Transcript_122863/g.238959 Transcript_122863/m.238959 type:complete len:124 (-) Transcript_122863:898-1269(-)